MEIAARIPLPEGAFETAHLAHANAVAFFSSRGWSAWSLVDGRRLWSEARHAPVRFLGADAHVAILQELRRPDGRTRWLEGIDLKTGASLFRNEATPEAIGASPVIDGHAYAMAAQGSLRVDLASGHVELSPARPWHAGPGGHYGIDGAHLTRFDGRVVHRVAKVPKLALLGVVGGHAVLARPHAADRVVLMDVRTAAPIELVLPSPMSVVLRSKTLVFAPAAGDAVALDVDAIVGASVDGAAVDGAAVDAAVAFVDVPVTWRLPGVLGVQRELDGEALLAVGAGILHARDGSVLVADPRIDRGCGTEAHLVAWSTQRGDTEATLYRA